MEQKSKFYEVSRTQSAIALCIAAISSAWAESTPTEITITAESPVRVSGFDGVTLKEQPFSVTHITNATLRDVGAQRVTDALRLDASVSDSYNLPAYWDKLGVRGFTLDNRYNFRREGLPISAETIVPMDNKQRIELLKGTSGMQSGTSSPGGLVNYVVKRAPQVLNSASAMSRSATVLATTDLSPLIWVGALVKTLTLAIASTWPTKNSTRTFATPKAAAIW